jgi:segregation and condensation protein A
MFESSQISTSQFLNFDSDENDSALILDIEGFEGPLDVLLELARRQKVDLRAISILALAEQYLRFIEAARALRLELAADYLVMAAWLAYLKSRLLLPEPPTDEDESPMPDELAAALAFKLQRLEVIRRVGRALDALPQLGRDTFTRGQVEPVNTMIRPVWQANIYDLLNAYGENCQKRSSERATLPQRQVWSLIEAREMLMKLIPDHARDWQTLDVLLTAYLPQQYALKDVKASSFSAALEMVREGCLHIRQDRAFAPLWLKQPEHVTVKE